MVGSLTVPPEDTCERENGVTRRLRFHVDSTGVRVTLAVQVVATARDSRSFDPGAQLQRACAQDDIARRADAKAGSSF